MELMVERGTWLVRPLRRVTPRRRWPRTLRFPSPFARSFADWGVPELDAFRLAADAGVKVAMGTDCPVAHGTNLHELQLMAENGFTPEEALIAATASAADLLGVRDELGTLEPGKLADVTVVDGDPFEFEKLPERVRAVYKEGVRVVG